MSLFDALGISGSGIDAMQTWIDTSAGNLANVNDAVTPGKPTYAEQTPVFSELPAAPGEDSGNGVIVSSIALGGTAGQIEENSGSPAANAKGEVALPNISTADQIEQVLEAQQAYSADSSALNKAVAAYQSGLTIGS